MLLVCICSWLAASCVGSHTLVKRDITSAGAFVWFSPSAAPDGVSLQRWRTSVGPPLVRLTGPTVAAGPADRITVVSWNTAVGDADVVGFVRRLRTPDDTRPLVLLLQEVYRKGSEVPQRLTAGAAFAGRLGNRDHDDRDRDIESIAAATDLNAYYVPSMRNGGPSSSDEDRGNAILSNVPLTDLAAIELPFERQRRVAVAGSIAVTTGAGTVTTIRLVSAHLDNMVGPRRLWIAGAEYARARQARALVSFLEGAEAAVLAGDFNTWFGSADQACIETARAFPDGRVIDPRATFHRLLRLDHAFFRLPAGWRAESRRGNDQFGSDHFPLISTIFIS